MIYFFIYKVKKFLFSSFLPAGLIVWPVFDLLVLAWDCQEIFRCIPIYVFRRVCPFFLFLLLFSWRILPIFILWFLRPYHFLFFFFRLSLWFFRSSFCIFSHFLDFHFKLPTISFRFFSLILPYLWSIFYLFCKENSIIILFFNRL